jgi:hypothetical protein
MIFTRLAGPRGARAMKRCKEEREPESDLEGVSADREEGQEEKDGGR